MIKLGVTDKGTYIKQVLQGLFVCVALSFFLASCNQGGGGGGSTSPQNIPQKLSVLVGDGEVTLSWQAVEGADSYSVYYGTGTKVSTTEYAEKKQVIEPEVTVTELINGTTYSFAVTAHQGSVESSPSHVSVTIPLPSPVITRKEINDTGQRRSGNYPDGNNVDCTSSTGIAAPQDCNLGRDATENDDSDGYAGFSFTKIDNNGNELPAHASSWSCVKDNVTGLIWQVKTNTSGLHNKSDAFSWYDTNSRTNGSNSGVERRDPYVYQNNVCYGYQDGVPSTYCNTQAYTQRVNAQGLCGANDWRMPHLEELRGIVSYGKVNPSIDGNYFPHTRWATHWTASPASDNTSMYGSGGVAWAIRFDKGESYLQQVHNVLLVRLVRTGGE